MNVVAVGLGGAGGRIVDALCRDETDRPVSYLAATRVVDTDRESLAALDAVPETARDTFGELIFEGHGTDRKREDTADAMAEQATEIRRGIDDAITTDVTAIVLVAGLGGGVGAGATPVLAAELDSIYDRPVYCVSVLPSTDEQREAENAAHALDELDRVVDSQIVFDNQFWIGDDGTLDGRIPELNRALADRLGTLFLAGDLRAAGEIGERVLDEQDVITTLASGGLASIGYASQSVTAFRASGDSFLDRVRGRLEGPDEQETYDAVTSTCHWALRGQLTLDCTPADAASGLVVFSGPPEWLDPKAVADCRTRLSEQIEGGELRTGDTPMQSDDEIAVLIAFAGIESAPRIEELRWYD